MRKVGLFALITALTSLIANFAKADSVVTTKSYVDAKISSSADISSTSTTTAPNEKAVYDAISSATSATSNLLTQVISDADTTHAPSGDAVYDALADKQNKIDSTGTALFDDAGGGGSVVTTTDSAGVVGERFIWTADGGDPTAWDIYEYYDSNAVRIAVRKAIPTVEAVEAGLYNKQNKLGGDSSSDGKVVTATANEGVVTYTTIKTSVDSSSDLITAGAVNSALATKQNKIDSTGTAPFYAAGGSVVTTTDSAGVVGERFIWTAENGDETTWYINSFYPDSATQAAVRNAIPTVQAVEVGLYNKQNKLGGGSSRDGKVVTATATPGDVTYTTIKTAVDSSSDLITAGAVKTYADAKVSAASSISSTSTTTAPNEKAVYDAINSVQSAVDTLSNCTHTCANSACTLITVNCVDSYQSGN